MRNIEKKIGKKPEYFQFEEMMDWIQFAHIERAIWLIAVLIIVLFVTWKMSTRKSQIGAFVSSMMQSRLVTSPTTGSRVLQIICLAVSGVLFVLALMQPQVVQQDRVVLAKESANIFVALDVSKSMLATDAAPNRLERAKSEIRDMLPQLSSHRVGLLAFAGRTTVLSPLTMDHGFFRLVLENASPESVTRGGTSIGDVIRKATELLSKHEGPKVLILITDGEDHETYPLEAADAARQAGVAIITVGFGSETGSTIDVLDKATGMKRRIQDSSGQDVISKLDVKLLKEISEKTRGNYIPAGTGVLELDSIMLQVILPLVEDSPVRTQEKRVELYPWFVGFGLLFFLGFMILEGRGFRRQVREKAA